MIMVLFMTKNSHTSIDVGAAAYHGAKAMIGFFRILCVSKFKCVICFPGTAEIHKTVNESFSLTMGSSRTYGGTN